jgi:tetratricopeptide (TPR) repeat protein
MGARAAMIKGKACPEPRRLVTEDDAAGALLRSADDAFRQGLAEGPAWQRFQARNSGNYWVLCTAALAACLALAALHGRPRVAVDADPLRVAAEHRVAPAPTSSAAPLEALSLTRRISPTTPSAVTPHSPRAPNRVAADVVDDATCRGLSTDGRAEQAVPCFRALGRGSDLKAQVALYEAARLSAERLHDARRALLLLDEHRQRFPESALRGEVDWLRVRSLEQAGRGDEALAASELLLATPAGRPLASKLHLLRGRIYADSRGDCTQAVREFVELLSEPGADGDDAELRRAQCLERLSRTAEARGAYERYLERAEPRRAALAKARLLALSPILPPEGLP